jgi:Carboxypeptidase regulatory-like domain
MKCFVVTVAAAMVLLSSAAFAQVDTGTIQGTVRDATGAVLPGANVTLINVDMGVSFQTKTNDVGIYQFPSVRIGSYTMVAEASGFAPATRDGITLSIQQRYLADFSLKPSNIAETITVTSDAATLQTQEASLGGVVQSKAINDLPLNGRNYTFLAQLSPGVVQSQQDTRGMGGNGSFSANGQNSFANNYLLDGVDNNSNLVDFVNGAGYVYRPSVDALQEFRVQTSSYSAELGRASGAVLNASLKSGGEQYRGSLFEFHRNSALDAINFFDEYQGLKKGKFIRNQFGVTLGGPMAFLTRGNKKTFFFVDYEGTVARQATTSILTTPTPRMQSSNFRDMSDLIRLQGGTRTDRLGRTYPLGTIMDPATTRFINAGAVDPVTGRTVTGTGGAWIRDPLDPSGNNAIPAGRINQNALNLLKEFPAATRTDVLAGNYAVNPITEDDNHQGDVRIDHYIDANNTMFGRFSAARSTTLVPAPYGGVIDGSQFGGGDQTVKVYSGALSWTRIYSTSLVSETRFGYSSIDHKRLPLNATDNTIAGRFGLRTPDYPYMGGLPLFTVDGIGQFGVPNNLPSIQYQSTYQLSTTFSKLADNHSWKWGFQFSRPMTEFFQPAAPRGGYGYSGTFTDVPLTTGGGTGMAQMLLTPIANTIALPECATTAVAPCKASFVGGPNSINVNRIPDPTPLASWQVWSGFIEDTWKITPKVTANLGLRYDFQRNAAAPDGAAANLLVEPTPRYVMAADRCRENLSPSFIAQAAADRIAIECADSNMLVTSPEDMFAPRLGLSYAFADDWVVRAGGGWFYLTSGTSGRNGGNNLVGTQLIYPYAYGVTITNLTPGAPVIYGDGSRGTFESGTEAIKVNDPTAFNAFNVSLGGIPSPWKVPLTIQYNVTLQHQLTASESVSVGYVGSQSRNQDLGFSSYNYNAVRVMAPPGLNANTFRVYPSFNGINQIQNIGKAEYNALQTSYEKLFTRGFAARANYTFSECRNQGRQGLVNNIGGYRSLWLLGPDWALCDSDAPHIISLAVGYELPFGEGHSLGGDSSGLVNQLISGWTLNAIGLYQSGPPFTIPCNIATTTGQGCNAVLTGQSLYPENRSFQGWLNPAAFTNPPVATTLGQSDLSPMGGDPTQVRGPDFKRLDLSIFKGFRGPGNQRFEFRAEIFNLTNTHNFSVPGFSGGGAGLPPLPGVLDFSNTANFGKITALRLGPNDQRQIQLALKYYF